MTIRIPLLLLAAFLVLAPAAGRADDAAVLRQALSAAGAGEWDRAQGLSRRAETALAASVIDWMRLRAGAGSWDEAARFLKTHPDWPGLALLRRKAEGVIPAGLEPDAVVAFFAGGAPQTGTGAFRLATALARAGRGEAARAEVRRAWTSLPMTAAERAAFQDGFAVVVDDNHWTRTDALLWAGATAEAGAMIPKLREGGQALARARIALQEDGDGVDALIAAVPARLAADPGLAFDRLGWRIRKGRWAEAEELLLAVSTDAAGLGDPARWGDRRRSLAREAMREGRARNAYRLAAQHHLTGGADYADLEWLAGYLALTRFDDPDRALAHFARFRAAVTTPISLGRAGYWEGRAHEAAGNPEAAMAAYAEGARHQSSFYGQLAAERAGLPADRALAGGGAAGGETGGATADWRQAGFLQSDVVQAALLLRRAGETEMMARFLLHAEEDMAPADSILLARMALDLGHPFVAVRIAKRLAEGGVVVPDVYYPVTDAAGFDLAVPVPLALAIARQESELNPAAVSPAGARGLMQLMPGTARKMAADLGEDYALSRLTDDPAWNARLGSGYLAQMLDRFGGSHVLAAAAYNAGPNRVDQWIAEYGDPRSPRVDPIDWIEMIPYRETQNYVMRVLEGVHVYRLRLGQDASAIGLTGLIGASARGG